VDIEQRKMDRFIDGSELKVRTALPSRVFTKYQDLYHRAIWVKKVLNENKIKNMNIERPSRENASFGEQKSISIMQGQKGGSTSRKKKYCEFYKKIHGGTECYWAIGKCFNCGKPGHKASHCP